MDIEIEDYNGNTRLVLQFPKVIQKHEHEQNFIGEVSSHTLGRDFNSADTDINEDGVSYIRVQYENDEDDNFQIDLAAYVGNLLNKLSDYHI